MTENAAAADCLPDEAKTVLILSNPIAGSGQRGAAVEHLSNELKHRGLQAQQIHSFDELSAAAAPLQTAGQLRAIIAAGGDGTIAEVANRTEPATPLAVFPLGTANLLANYLQIPRDPARCADIIAAGHTIQLDAGRANGRLFLLVASVGFDAEVVRRLHSARTGHISGWAYAKPIWQTIRSYTYPPLRVYYALNQELRNSEVGASGVVAGWKTSAGNGNAAGLGGNMATTMQLTSAEESNAAWDGPITCCWAFVFNVSRYAGGLNFAPAASGCDGQLDLCTFQRGGLWSGLKYLTAVVRGRHSALPEFTSQHAARFRIECDENVLYELDGDPGGTLPLTIETVPQRLRLLIPPQWSD